ncbi:MAG: GNAT family N-acetyltransferase [Bacteroidetes bacterium]|nr:GNAT family N-acetyltransferase [Bacteroidota bacterium]
MIETDKLILKPLTHSQLVKYIQCDHSLEQELNLNETKRSLSPDLKEALEQTILPNVADPDKNYLYSTLWTAISKTEQKMVGDLCLYGEPDAAGAVEIGYGTHEEFRNKGLMTEALGGLIGWAALQPTVKTILASTNKANTASWKVLEKNGFIRTGEKENLLTWKLDLK